MAHEHIVVDTDNRFIIDENTREISLSTGYATVMQYDHNSERITFELPRMIDGHDMTLCNEVQVHYINIDASTKESNAGVYDVTDLRVSEGSDEKATLSWLISQNATQYAGALNFVVKFKCIADDGTVEYSWGSAIFKGMTVSNGLDNGNATAEEYSDILAAWEARIQALEEGGGGASSWNDLEDKPFYEETTTVSGDTLTWDGNTEGLECVEVPDAGGMLMVKLSDAIPRLKICLMA